MKTDICAECQPFLRPFGHLIFDDQSLEIRMGNLQLRTTAACHRARMKIDCAWAAGGVPHLIS